MSTSSPLISGHIIGVAVPGWGHQKPLAALASRIVQERSDILFTILAVGHFGERIEKEINRYLPNESPKANIRIINIGGQPNDMMENFSVIIKNFEPVYKLVHSEPIMCTTGRLYASAPRPTLAILDFFLPESAQVIRDISGNDVSILAWNTANASFCLRTLGPEKLGGYGDVAKQASEEAAATGRPVLEIEQEFFSPSKGEVISIPGLPPMFDYEFAHKTASKDQFHNELLKKGQRFMPLCDGMISTSSIAYEKESLDAWRDWLAETNRHLDWTRDDCTLIFMYDTLLAPPSEILISEFALADHDVENHGPQKGWKRAASAAEHTKSAANEKTPSRTSWSAKANSDISISDGGASSVSYMKIKVQSSRSTSLQAAEKALFGHGRPVSQRIHWMF
ncbi:hypothetical protein BU17DRAFT_80798 [Hysterangium stoloniferum]|nr:hypothetical protein BU17DRAFT_80798 [Hysterangium stoloniferum]